MRAGAHRESPWARAHADRIAQEIEELDERAVSARWSRSTRRIEELDESGQRTMVAQHTPVSRSHDMPLGQSR
jgi:hypothetical protein